MASLECPLCNGRVFGSNKDRLIKVLCGISNEMEILKEKETYIDYGKIINETVVWSLFQEKRRKYSAPVDMIARIKRVIGVNYANMELDEETLELMSIHVNDILSLIHSSPNSSITKRYYKETIFFDDKKYLEWKGVV